MSTIKELSENKKVSHVKNSKAPAGFRVELCRDKDGAVIEFKVLYPNGKVISEKNDYRNELVKSDNPFWEPFNEVEYQKSLGEPSVVIAPIIPKIDPPVITPSKEPVIIKDKFGAIVTPRERIHELTSEVEQTIHEQSK